MMPVVIRERSGWHRFGLLLVVALLTVATFASVVHRHIGADEQGCVLCHVRHDPGLNASPVTVLVAPEFSERPFLIAEILSVSCGSVPLRPGRAPPSSL